jgi:general secretion pathway protein K
MQSAPQADFPGEAWASIGQDEIAIEGGTFSLAIRDATGKFNLTNLASGGPEALPFLQKILDELAISDAARLQLVTRLANPAPLTAMDDLRAAGLSPGDIRQLSTLVTVLPNPTAINLNTMPDAMFNVLAGNPVQARLLQGLRARRGQISPSDLLDAGLIPAVRVAVSSDVYIVTTRAMIGDVRQARESLLVRSLAPTGPQVIVAARRAVE